jgi:hypothetical protein
MLFASFDLSRMFAMLRRDIELWRNMQPFTLPPALPNNVSERTELYSLWRQTYGASSLNRWEETQCECNRVLCYTHLILKCLKSKSGLMVRHKHLEQKGYRFLKLNHSRNLACRFIVASQTQLLSLLLELSHPCHWFQLELRHLLTKYISNIKVLYS